MLWPKGTVLLQPSTHPLHHASRRAPAANQVRESILLTSAQVKKKKWLVISSYRVFWGRKRPTVLNGISTKQSPNHSNRLAVPVSPAVDPIAPVCPQAFLHRSYRSHPQLSQLVATTVTGKKFMLDSFKLNRYRCQIGLWPILTNFSL